MRSARCRNAAHLVAFQGPDTLRGRPAWLPSRTRARGAYKMQLASCRSRIVRTGSTMTAQRLSDKTSDYIVVHLQTQRQFHFAANRSHFATAGSPRLPHHTVRFQNSWRLRLGPRHCLSPAPHVIFAHTACDTSWVSFPSLFGTTVTYT